MVELPSYITGVITGDATNTGGSHDDCVVTRRRGDTWIQQKEIPVVNHLGEPEEPLIIGSRRELRVEK